MMTMITEAPAFDAARAERFAEHMARALNDAALVIMTSIGHRSGLFDTMARISRPATSIGIAAEAGLAERYVREWLAAMTTGGVLEYDPAGGTWRLPPEHAAWLTRAASPNNLAVTAQFIPQMGAMQALILERFRTGGGTVYADYPCFHEVMAEDSGQTVVAALFDSILPLVPGLMGRLEAGIEVLDAGCGRGRALLEMAARFPHSRFTGYDLCEEAVAWGRARAAERGLTNLRFEARDLAGWEEPGRFDLVCTFDAVHDQRDPAGLLRGIARSLNPGGVYLMQDIGGSSRLQDNLGHPFGTLLYAISTMHCMPVSLGQGGPGLGTMWGEETAERMLREAGFAAVEKHRLPHDPMNVYFVARNQ